MTIPDPDERTEVVQPRDTRARAVRIVCALIRVVCVLFALALAVHIVLVLGNANPGNGFAQFIGDWSAGVSLGFRDLFTPSDAKVRVLLNEGLAAIAWLIISAVLTTLINRIVLPGSRLIRY